MIILSLVLSLLLTELGKYFFNIRSFSRVSFFSLFLYYTVLIFFIQILTFFWVIYILADYMLRKKKNKILIAFVSGTGTFLIAQLISYLRLETYYFEPFKNFYQVIIFFIAGFLYPYLSIYINKKILNS